MLCRHTPRTKPLLLSHDVPPLRVRHHQTPILHWTICHCCLWIHININSEVLAYLNMSHKNTYTDESCVTVVSFANCLTSTSWILLAFLASVFDNVPLTTGSSKQTCRKVRSALISAPLLSEEQHIWIIMLYIYTVYAIKIVDLSLK